MDEPTSIEEALTNAIKRQITEALGGEGAEMSFSVPVTVSFECADGDEETFGSSASMGAGGGADIPGPMPDSDLEDCLAKLDSLIGLEGVKKEVKALTNLLRVRKMRTDHGIKSPDISLHLVFSGNPGTGKTTVARLLARIYRALGVLSRGHLVEVDRASLVAGYVGQTAMKVQSVVREALGGVLFIDEAYSLAGPDTNDFGHEAVQTLLKQMEDHRDDLVVIAAGYPELMEMFLGYNPGLASRFARRIIFEDYSAEQLSDIFQLMCRDNEYDVDQKGLVKVRRRYERILANPPGGFGNGRDVRNLFEQALMEQACRIVRRRRVTAQDLKKLTSGDIEAADIAIGRVSS